MNKNLMSESDLHAKLDNLSRKYSINIIIENREDMMPISIGYIIDKNAVIVNIPIFLDLINNQRKFSKFSDAENFIEAKFLHEFHHSKIKRIDTDLLWLLNLCEDYYINNILMKDNEALMKENIMFREISSARTDDDKLDIMFPELDTIFLLCSIYDKDQLKNIYGNEIINYKNIFEKIKCENDIGGAFSALKKLYEKDREDVILI